MSDPAPATVPLFPLGMVQFPGFPLDLQVFEPRYLTLLSDLRKRGQQEFGVITIRSGHEVGVGNVHSLAEVGCMVRIERTVPQGSRIMVRARGTWRFDQIELIDDGRAYRSARVRRLIDHEEPDPASAGRLRSALEGYAAAAHLELPTLPSDPDELIWLITAVGPFTEPEQLQALAAPRRERIELLIGWLRRETRLLRETGSVPFRTDRTPPAN